MRELCIAGRGSRLAMAQNELVKKLLEQEGYKVNILTVSTKGDRDRKSSVTALGGNGPFVRDVEKALLSKEADIAVHCVKDLPYEMAPGLCIAGMPDAADPRDCLILRDGLILRQGTAGKAADNPLPIGTGSHLPIGTDNPLTIGTGRPLIIGTGSPRRISQLRAISDKLGMQAEFKDIRGNITTRLEKLRSGEYDGIVLAKAGLDRIGADLSGFDVRILEPEEMIPAVGQGMLACECRESDAEMRALLDRITPPENYLRYEIERGIFCRFRCDCRSAVGIHARISPNSADLLLMYEE
ncbi:MAG: hydroxymethylbilane synthase [Lachnospiraceae bacterium]|nr:hydroxymethylbilane synthase [Lachnospiraceae bacterium]MBQ9033884.1 hydroxymethylbilane synthase [Lachnospiraceae bacterium]